MSKPDRSVPVAASPVFAFEEIGPDLDLVPLAARRALDLAGLRLPLEGWRSLRVEDRLCIAHAGVPDAVDVSAVAAIVARASPAAERIEVVPDPDSRSLPAGIPTVVLPLSQWAFLRPIERYALAHACRSAIRRGDPALFEAAYHAVLSAPPLSELVSLPFAFSPTLSTLTPSEGASRSPVSPEPVAWPPPASGQSFAAAEGSATASTVDVSNAWPGRGKMHETLVSELAPHSEQPASSLSSHLDASGAARMVDISTKTETHRRAVASGSVTMMAETALRIVREDAPKGEVIGAARIAGIMAAKRTPELIPLCHGVALTHVHVDVQVRVDAESAEVRVTATAEAFDRTGVEMEAMVAVSVACLTIYDMLKGIDRAMTITGVKLLEKSGGRSGHYKRGGAQA